MMSKKELALVFEQLEKEQSFNGTMLVSQGGEVLFEKAYGFASRQLNVPNVLETKFHIASVTKMFIAMAALILYEQGLIELHEFRMHGGGTPGFLSRIRQYPEQKVSIILLFNSDHVNTETIFSAVEPPFLSGRP